MLLFEISLWLLTIHSSVHYELFTSPPCLCEVTGFVCTAVTEQPSPADTKRVLNLQKAMHLKRTDPAPHIPKATEVLL